MIEFKEFVTRYLFLHQKLLKKSLFFIFFILLVSSISFYIIGDHPNSKIKKHFKIQKNRVLKLFNLSYDEVNIVGIVNSDENQIKEIVKNKVSNIGFKNLGSKIIDDIRVDIEKINWVKEVFINRNIASNLDIKIVEYSPFAIWDYNNKRYIIDKDGIKIDVKNIDDFGYLLVVNGDNARLKVKSLFNIFSAKPEIGRYVYSASLIGNRRWDIRFINNILVKLPEKNIEKAWKRLEKIYNDQDLINDITVIDLRIKNKTFLKIDNE